MKVLVIGFGSIAQKHVHSIWKIDPSTSIFALRSGVPENYSTDKIINLYKWSDLPSDIDFVIISNPTSFHRGSIEKSCDLGVPLFIEKPPLHSLDGAEELIAKIAKSNIPNYVAFHMRFHPVLEWIKQHIDLSHIIEVQSYCGSYLPDWRPDRDYRSVYSSSAKMGGGVHLDLIHEMDFLKWILGEPIRTDSFLSKRSSLEIDSPDCAHFWLQYEGYNASILLNYYRRVAKRTVEIVTEDEVFLADLLNFKVLDSNGRIVFSKKPDVLGMYEKQMQFFIENIRSGISFENDFASAIKTLELTLS